jgi:choloylglycine hydrolase
MVVGRNMDWVDPMPVDLWAMPRGIKRDGMTGRNTLAWTARYGSILAVGEAAPGMSAASDGMNEKGLAAQLLWLAESGYGTRDENLPGLSIGLWVQYFLDNFSTVSEAVEFTRNTPFQLVTATMPRGKVTVHLSLGDASGDSAIIEYIDGKPKIYHDRGYTVMTNSPTFDKQLEQLSQYKGFGGEKPLPGTTDAADRFVRGAYYLKSLPKPNDYRECVAGVLGVMRNISQPFGTSDPTLPNISATRWRTVADLTNLVYFFESTISPNIIWVRFKEFDFSAGAPVRKLDLVKNVDRVGDCSLQFVIAKPFAVPPPGR